MGLSIDGTIIRGLGAASTTIRLQLPHIIAVFPEIRNCRTASINLQLDHPLRVNNPHYTTEPIPWYQRATPEKISLLRIEIECPVGKARRNAWIYIAEFSPHRPDLFHAEIIAEHIPEAALGIRCRLHIADPHVTAGVLIV